MKEMRTSDIWRNITVYPRQLLITSYRMKLSWPQLFLLEESFYSSSSLLNGDLTVQTDSCKRGSVTVINLSEWRLFERLVQAAWVKQGFLLKQITVAQNVVLIASLKYVLNECSSNLYMFIKPISNVNQLYKPWRST